MEENTDKQPKNKVDYIAPFMWKKGQSGNPAGRPKGKTMKEYAKELLACQTEEERQEFLHGLSKDIIWKMAEGNPESKSELKVDSLDGFTPEELIEAKKILVNRIKSNSTPTESGTRTESESVGSTQED
jgi:hypothetical protein